MSHFVRCLSDFNTFYVLAISPQVLEVKFFWDTLSAAGVLTYFLEEISLLEASCVDPVDDKDDNDRDAVAGILGAFIENKR